MSTVISSERSSHSVNGAHDEPERFDVVVIGGGQAGLATGYYLGRHGLRFVILDAHDRVGDAWRKRWDSLVLFTPAKYSGLPGLRLAGSAFAFPTKDEIADYLERYANTMNLPVRTGTTVHRVGSEGGLWRVETSNGSLVTDAVVIATGGYPAPKIPEWAVELDPGIMRLHSRDYRRPSQLQPGDVLVVGASHSGAEIAVELAAEYPTVLVGRDTGQIPFTTGGRADRILAPLIWFAVNHVLAMKTPMGRKARRHVRAHGFPLERPRRSHIAAAGVERITERVVGTRDGKPMLAGGRVLDVSNIIWCTGFTGDYDWIEGVRYGDDGYPVQDHGVVAEAPGLHFVGLKFQTRAASALIGGVGRDARIVADHIAASVRRSV
jgi:putative flavoprotein involved in K+ transport